MDSIAKRSHSRQVVLDELHGHIVTAITTGQTVVTATSVDGGLTAQCLVTVKNNAKVYVERITLDMTELEMYVGEKKAVTPTVYPDNATERQREEWVRLFAIDEIKGDLVTEAYSVPLTMESLPPEMHTAIRSPGDTSSYRFTAAIKGFHRVLR